LQCEIKKLKDRIEEKETIVEKNEEKEKEKTQIQSGNFRNLNSYCKENEVKVTEFCDFSVMDSGK